MRLIQPLLPNIIRTSAYTRKTGQWKAMRDRGREAEVMIGELRLQSCSRLRLEKAKDLGIAE